jgi:hypothetical protein
MSAADWQAFEATMMPNTDQDAVTRALRGRAAAVAGSARQGVVSPATSIASPAQEHGTTPETIRAVCRGSNTGAAT